MHVPILIFTNSFQIGGSERQAVEFVKCINRTQFQPYLACFRRDGPLQDELPGYLGAVRAYPLCGFFNATAIRRAFGFLTFLRESRVQVVQCFDFYTNLFAIPLARMARVPVILAARREEALTKTPAQRRAERWCYRLATGVVANAEAIKEQVVKRDGIRPERVWTVHNGVDLKRFDYPDRTGQSDSIPKKTELTIGVVANLRPEKGHSVFFEAARHLTNVYPHVRFVVVGDGYFRRQIEARVNELGLTKSVCMMGAVNNVPAILKTMDVAVLPSLSNEGFPNSVMEAMAAGLPVVATDTGGTRELVVDGATGYVVQPGDAAALANRLAILCDDSGMRRKMGALGRSRIEREFTVDKMALKLETLYQSLLKIQGQHRAA
jgi:glycosyltransferase involved in cell wall biosynthesis